MNILERLEQQDLHVPENWVEIAKEHLKNEEHYRELLIKIGLLFGEKDFNGPIQFDKIPELVENALKWKAYCCHILHAHIGVWFEKSWNLPQETIDMITKEYDEWNTSH